MHRMEIRKSRERKIRIILQIIILFLFKGFKDWHDFSGVLKCQFYKTGLAQILKILESGFGQPCSAAAVLNLFYKIGISALRTLKRFAKSFYAGHFRSAVSVILNAVRNVLDSSLRSE